MACGQSILKSNLKKRTDSTVESRFLEPSILRTSRYIEPKVVSPPQSNTVILPPILELPDFSNQFPFPLEVRKNGIPLYVSFLNRIIGMIIPRNQSYPLGSMKLFSKQLNAHDLFLDFRQSSPGLPFCH